MATTWFWAADSDAPSGTRATHPRPERTQPRTPAHARLLTVSMTVRSYMGQLDDARRLGAACLETWRALGDRHETAVTLVRIADFEAYMGDPVTRTREPGRERRAGRRHSARRRVGFRRILVRRPATSRPGDFDTAERLLEEALAIAQEDGDVHTLQNVLRPLGIIAGERGDAARSHQLRAEAVQAGRAFDDVYGTMGTLIFLAFAAVKRGQAVRGARLLALLIKRWEQQGYRAVGLVGVEDAVTAVKAALRPGGVRGRLDRRGARATWEQVLRLCDSRRGRRDT